MGKLSVEEKEAKKDKIIEDNGMEYDIVRSKNYLYDKIVTLYFDKNWNFVKQ